jgi:hypothetical protein
MSSLSFTDIGLKPAQVKAVAKRAKAAGKTPTEYLRSLVERDLFAGGSFDDVLRPIREGFKKAGVTENELDTLVMRARKDLTAQRFFPSERRMHPRSRKRGKPSGRRC